MRILQLLLVIPVVSLSVQLQSALTAAETVWLRTLDVGACDSSIAWADVAAPVDRELVMTTTAGSVVIWNVLGEPHHQITVGGVISAPPTVADLFPGGHQEILAVNQAGLLTCLGDRKVLWQYQLPAQLGWNNTTVVAEDLDSDGSVDILVGDTAGNFICLSPEGVEQWKYPVPGGFHCPPAVADVSSEPGTEVVFSAASGKLICLSAAGKALWQTDLGCDNTSGPVIADLDGDKSLEIVLGGFDNHLHCFGSEGRIRWKFQATGQIDSAISCGDIDGDAKCEIIFVDLRGKCFCVDAEGRQRWQYNVRNRCRRSPLLADFDGDGGIEVLVAGYDRRIYLLAHDGQEKDILDVPADTNGGATLIESGGRLCAVVPYADGKVGCYTWLGKEAARGQRVLWGAYRVTPTRRGSFPVAPSEDQWPRVERVSYGEMLVGRNVLEVAVTNPNRDKLILELRIHTTPADTVLTESIESDQERFVGTLPYLVNGAGPETFVFSHSVKALASQRPLLAGRKTVFVEPFLRDLDVVGALIGSLREIEAGLRNAHHRDTRHLAGRRLWLEQRLSELASRVAHPSRLSGADRVACAGDLRELAAEVDQSLALARIAKARLDAGKQAIFAVWPANPWSQIRPLTDRADRIADPSPEDSTVMLYRNEHESLAVDVLNLLDTPLDVRLRFPDRFGDESSPALSVGEVIGVPTEIMSISADAISALNQARMLHLAPGEVRQVWIDVDATACRAGSFTCNLNLSSLTPESVVVNVPISANVLDLDITAAPAPRFCNWAYLHTSCLKEYESQARSDLIAHGTNVFVVVGPHVPQVGFDQTGKLTGQADFTQHDAFIRSHGPDALFLFTGPQGTVAGPRDCGFGSEPYRKAYKSWIPQWVAHLKQLGVGYDRFAFYPVDEPGLTPGLVETYVGIARLTREADPEVLMYTDPVGRATIEEIERMAPFVDIWCPNRNGFLMTDSDPRLDLMRKHGKQVWTYECDGNVKHRSPLGYYRGLAWLAEFHGITGIGFWSYSTSQHDPWYVPPNDHDYLLVYPGAGIISSRRWEACRDGLEDLRAVWQLKSQADAVRRADPQDERAKRADQVARATATDLAGLCRADTVLIPTTSPATGAGRRHSAFDVSDEQSKRYRDHRARIAEATMAFRR